jgi:hypothetical protein
MGETYPKSTFSGIDVSDAFPKNKGTSNVNWCIGNIIKGILYSKNIFDYIHQRLLFAGLTNEDWKKVSFQAMA